MILCAKKGAHGTLLKYYKQSIICSILYDFMYLSKDDWSYRQFPHPSQNNFFLAQGFFTAIKIIVTPA